MKSIKKDEGEALNESIDYEGEADYLRKAEQEDRYSKEMERKKGVC